MNAGDAVDALIGILVAGVAEVNAALDGTGYTLKLDAGIAAQDTSPYRYIKRGDRVKLPDGLTICFVAGGSRKVNFLAPNTSEKEASIQIVAYLMDEHDPHAREAARVKVADALRDLYNRIPNREVVTDAGTFYNAEVGEEQFRYFERVGETRMGQVAAGVILPWTALYYVTETDTNG